MNLKTHTPYKPSNSNHAHEYEEKSKNNVHSRYRRASKNLEEPVSVTEG